LQDGVNEIYGAFTSHVTKYRYGVQSEHMQGQAFMAENAKRIGLIDEVVNGIEDVHAFRQKVTPRP
jgi:ClpP class serine protease